MLDKESLASILLAQDRTLSRIDLNGQQPHPSSFEREKAALVREILSFHFDRFSQKYHQPERKANNSSNLLPFLLNDQRCPKEQYSSFRSSDEIAPQSSRTKAQTYYNDYHKASKSHEKKHFEDNIQNLGVIDLFLKPDTSRCSAPLVLESLIAKCENKSFNQSTMAVSNLQRSSLSPHRKIRKTENFNSQRLADISEYNSSESLFNLTENQSDLTSKSKQSQSKKDEIKKVLIDLNVQKIKTPKHCKAPNPSLKLNMKTKTQQKLDASLEEVQQYDEFFDCSSEKQKKKEEVSEQRQGVFNYLKNKFAKQKQNKMHRNPSSSSEKQNICEYSSSNGSSLNSFYSKIQNQKQQARQNGVINIGAIIDQTVKAVSQNINNHQIKNDEHNISGLLFPSTSQPSTVQKLDDRSNDKSQLLKHLQDLEQYSMSAELFKKVEPIENKAEPIQTKPQKHVNIDISSICDDVGTQELFHELITEYNQSSQNPSMPSFKMESIMHANDHSLLRSKDCKNDQIKRIEIQLETSQVNLDDLSNYDSDESYEQFKEKKMKNSQRLKEITPLEQNFSHNKKQKSKIILKSVNFIPKKSQEDNEAQCLNNLKQDITQMKSYVRDLQKRMLKEGGMRGQSQ